MTTIDRSDYSLVGIMPVVPLFDFDGAASIEAPAAWEYMAAMHYYDEYIRPVAHEWSIKRGQQVWARIKPWYCHI